MPFNPGGFESALKLKRFDGHIIISKKYSLKDWLEFVNGNIDIMPGHIDKPEASGLFTNILWATHPPTSHLSVQQGAAYLKKIT